ncbi:MAG: FHA domain-containing protein [Verrucomicrobiota bacterium]
MTGKGQVIQQLEKLAADCAEGVLYLEESHYRGMIFLKDAHVIHSYAENDHGALEEGYHSLLRLFALKDAVWEWQEGLLPENESMKIPINYVIEAEAALSQNINKGVIRETAMITRPHKEIRDLKHCSIMVHIDKGSLEGETFLLLPEKTTLGRRLTCDISIPDVTVSIRHCNFLIEKNEIIIEDLESFNGTRINGVRIKRHVVTPDDEVEVGEVKLHLSYAEKASITKQFNEITKRLSDNQLTGPIETEESDTRTMVSPKKQPPSPSRQSPYKSSTWDRMKKEHDNQLKDPLIPNPSPDENSIKKTFRR